MSDEPNNKPCPSDFDGVMRDRSVSFSCDLWAGHDGPHVERGDGWRLLWHDEASR